MKIVPIIIVLVLNILFYTAKLGYKYTGFEALWYEANPGFAIYIALVFLAALIAFIYFAIKKV